MRRKSEVSYFSRECYRTMKKIPDKILDKLWASKIKERAKGKCEVCPKDGTNAHHIIGRKNYPTRWVLDNGIYLCYSCHMFNPKCSAHATPTIFQDIIKKTIGTKRWNRLHKTFRDTQGTKVDREKVKEELG